MESIFLCQCFPLELLLLLCFLSVCSAMPKTNITTDQSALLALKAHISIDPQGILAKNWSVDYPVCGWIGVTCDSRHHRVTALNISNMNLTGIIPPQFGNLSFLVSLDMSVNNFHGEVPGEFAGLRRLRVLDLKVNKLNGGLPRWLGSFQELQLLSLGNNSFTGGIPSSISNMSKLETLRLPNNFLGGEIPAEIFNISSLEIISFLGNSLSGTLPDQMCQHLQRLTLLNLSKNALNGQIPSTLDQCSQLQILSLSYNNFTGSIPGGIGNLKFIQQLFLARNNLTGFVPKEIGNMTALQVLSIGRNRLEGEIPKEICNLTMLWLLDFGHNNPTGVIPREIGKLYNLEELHLEFNGLTGPIPTEFFNLSMMRMISIPGNQFSGNLPSGMCYELPSLEELFLAQNNFSGAIPDSISNCSQLNTIDFSENKFTGSIPNSFGSLSLLEILTINDNDLWSDPTSLELFISSLANCKYLRVLATSNNALNGVLPESVGNLSSSSLEGLYLDNCNISGSIPDGIGNLSSLIILELSRNPLIGSLPSTIKDLEKLQQILLSTTKLGDINLDYLCVFKQLSEINLEENQILGSIPECLGNVTSLRNLYLGSNRLNSSLPTSLWNLKDLLELNLSSNFLSGTLSPEIRNLQAATLIDLSINNLSGGIPNVTGDMKNLKNFSLAHNRLQGSIPESIGSMLSLQSLDLSHNSLSGKLPRSLEGLQYLTYFNVSFNNLSGEIPSKGPFLNFNGESFISNEALCGALRFRVSPCPRTSAHRLRIKKMHLVLIVVLGMITVVAAMSFGLVYFRYHRKEKVSSEKIDLPVAGTQERISYYTLLQATDQYSDNNLIGKGGFGSVYKGTLDDGRVVAIKVFNLQVEEVFKSFDAECEILRNLRHRNLTKIITSCSNLEFKALVLEFMPNGSLEEWLYSNNFPLDIIQRLDILIDVACALQYLHYEYSTTVVHCDLKPSNVLLDEDMVAHVSDFGIAKLLSLDQSITHTQTLATFGYLAPEFGMEGLVSTRCDAYSFGIMMMEVFTRTNPKNEMFGENLSLKSWVNDHLLPQSLANIIDANLLKVDDEYFNEKLDSISSIMKMALNCTRESPRERSNIRDVLVALKKIKLELLPYHRGAA